MRHEQFIVDSQGEKNAVIIPIEEYEELLEDILDLAILAERKNEDCISLQELKTRIK